MSCSGLLQAAGCSSLSRGVPALLNLSVYSRVALLALGLSAFCVIDLDFVRQLLATASAQSILVALLGLCFYPGARATVSRNSSSGGTGTPKQQCGSMAGTEAAAAATDRGPLPPTAERLAALNAAQAANHMGRSSDRQHADDAACITSSASSSGTSYRRRPFLLRIPRVSIELTPLPRISLVVREASTTTTSSSSSNSGLVPGAKWRPSMIRIKSGQDLVALLPPVNVPGCSRRRSRELAAERCRYEQLPSPTLAHLPTPSLQPCGGLSSSMDEGSEQEASSSEGGLGQPAVDSCEATASLGRDLLCGDMREVQEAIPEAHLLQFGAMLGESSSRAALQQQEGAGPVGHPSSLYGSSDTNGFYGPWEPLVQEVTQGAVQYWAWRRPLRKGLYMYMTRTVFLHAAPAEVRRFMLDDAYRVSWDNSMLRLQHVAPSDAAMAAAAPEAGAAGVSAGDSGVLYAQVRFPKPMASRSYTYARRVWLRPADGGCYSLARACSHPAAPAASGRMVPVADYASGCVVRAPASHLLPAGYQGPSAEVLMVYFEDSLVRPGLANMGIKKGLWPMVQRTDKALRVYQANGLAAPAGSTCVTPLTGTASSSAGWSGPPTPSASNTPVAAGSSSSSQRSWWQALAAVGAAAATTLANGLLAPGWALGALLQQVRQVQRSWGRLLPTLEWRLFRWVLQACSPPAHRLGLQLSSLTSSSKAGGGKAGPDAAAVAAAAGLHSFPVPSSDALVKEWPLPRHPSGPSGSSSGSAQQLLPTAAALAHGRRRTTAGPLPRTRRPASRSSSHSSNSSFGGGITPRPVPPLTHPSAASCGVTPPTSSSGGCGNLHRVDSHPLTEALVAECVPKEASAPPPAAAAAAACEVPQQGLKICSSVPLLDLGAEAEADSSEDAPALEALGAAAAPPPRASSFDIRLLYQRPAVARSAGSASSSGSSVRGNRASDPGCGMEVEAAAACEDWVVEVQGCVEDGAWRPPRPGSGGGHYRSSRLGPGGSRGGGGGGLTRTVSSDLESVGAASSRGSSRGGGGGSSSSRGSGRRSAAHQRRIVVGLVQAAGVRLAHHLLTAQGGNPH